MWTSFWGAGQLALKKFSCEINRPTFPKRESFKSPGNLPQGTYRKATSSLANRLGIQPGYPSPPQAVIPVFCRPLVSAPSAPPCILLSYYRPWARSGNVTLIRWRPISDWLSTRAGLTYEETVAEEDRGVADGRAVTG